MTANNDNPESKGSKPRDRAHPHRPFWRHAHRDWRVWCAAVLMLALMLVYVMTNDLSLRPGKPVSQPTPAETAP